MSKLCRKNYVAESKYFTNLLIINCVLMLSNITDYYQLTLNANQKSKHKKQILGAVIVTGLNQNLVINPFYWLRSAVLQMAFPSVHPSIQPVIIDKKFNYLIFFNFCTVVQNHIPYNSSLWCKSVNFTITWLDPNKQIRLEMAEKSSSTSF